MPSSLASRSVGGAAATAAGGGLCPPTGARGCNPLLRSRQQAAGRMPVPLVRLSRAKVKNQPSTTNQLLESQVLAISWNQEQATTRTAATVVQQPKSGIHSHQIYLEKNLATGFRQSTRPTSFCPPLARLLQVPKVPQLPPGSRLQTPDCPDCCRPLLCCLACADTGHSGQ